MVASTTRPTYSDLLDNYETFWKTYPEKYYGLKKHEVLELVKQHTWNLKKEGYAVPAEMGPKHIYIFLSYAIAVFDMKAEQETLGEFIKDNLATLDGYLSKGDTELNRLNTIKMVQQCLGAFWN